MVGLSLCRTTYSSMGGHSLRLTGWQGEPWGRLRQPSPAQPWPVRAVCLCAGLENSGPLGAWAVDLLLTEGRDNNSETHSTVWGSFCSHNSVPPELSASPPDTESLTGGAWQELLRVRLRAVMNLPPQLTTTRRQQITFSRVHLPS